MYVERVYSNLRVSLRKESVSPIQKLAYRWFLPAAACASQAASQKTIVHSATAQLLDEARGVQQR